MYLPQKPSRYGFLFKSLGDSVNAYIFRSHIYAGRPVREPTEHYIQGIEETVLALLRQYSAFHEIKGRNLTCDRLYSSLDLADALMEEFTMTFLGTLNKNRKGLPADFKRTDGREEGDYMILYDVSSKKSIHSWITNTKSGPKNVMVLTTTCPILGKTWDDERYKPALYKRYDYSMLAIDRVDQLAEAKSVRFRSKRWTMGIVSYMLDTARVNCRTISLLQEGRVTPDTRKFGLALVRSLVTPHIQRRVCKHGVQNFVRTKARCYLGDEEVDRLLASKLTAPVLAVGRQKRIKRCSSCTLMAPDKRRQKNLKKVGTSCQQCQEVKCLDHLILICEQCEVRGRQPLPCSAQRSVAEEVFDVNEEVQMGQQVLQPQPVQRLRSPPVRQIVPPTVLPLQQQPVQRFLPAPVRQLVSTTVVPPQSQPVHRLPRSSVIQLQPQRRQLQPQQLQLQPQQLQLQPQQLQLQPQQLQLQPQQLLQLEPYSALQPLLQPQNQQLLQSITVQLLQQQIMQQQQSNPQQSRPHQSPYHPPRKLFVMPSPHLNSPAMSHNVQPIIESSDESPQSSLSSMGCTPIMSSPAQPSPSMGASPDMVPPSPPPPSAVRSRPAVSRRLLPPTSTFQFSHATATPSRRLYRLDSAVPSRRLYQVDSAVLSRRLYRLDTTSSLGMQNRPMLVMSPSDNARASVGRPPAPSAAAGALTTAARVSVMLSPSPRASVAQPTVPGAAIFRCPSSRTATGVWSSVPRVAVIQSPLSRAPAIQPPVLRAPVALSSMSRTDPRGLRPALPPAHLAGDYDDADGAGCSHW